jgi:deazaflavin-dependent oxidoreductase (nitroreductase family)
VKQYRTNRMTSLVNAVFSAMVRKGRGPAPMHVLTTTGRKSGQSRSVPVDVIEIEGVRYLVAPYGPVGWVHNIRANPEVTLSRGHEAATWQAAEVHGAEAVQPIREYIRLIRVTKDYWEVGPDASDEQIEAIVPRHPVFRLVPSGSASGTEQR